MSAFGEFIWSLHHSQNSIFTSASISPIRCELFDKPRLSQPVPRADVPAFVHNTTSWHFRMNFFNCVVSGKANHRRLMLLDSDLAYLFTSSSFHRFPTCVQTNCCVLIFHWPEYMRFEEGICRCSVVRIRMILSQMYILDPVFFSRVVLS